jgi:hypothetical protein
MPQPDAGEWRVIGQPLPTCPVLRPRSPTTGDPSRSGRPSRTQRRSQPAPVRPCRPAAFLGPPHHPLTMFRQRYRALCNARSLGWSSFATERPPRRERPRLDPGWAPLTGSGVESQYNATCGLRIPQRPSVFFSDTARGAGTPVRPTRCFKDPCTLDDRSNHG